ncbi:hypothetical protein EDB83DRAFT_1384873 [Lactarius deliciosus]|nr:hypothetical protein EDB83DRAFT_1384873 [Lactarius deliciosus]
MAHYDIFRHHLAMKFPAYGHALWEPDPGNLYPPVEVGDVGYIREGKFRRLFNVLYPAEHPSHSNFGVPEYHEQLTPSVEHHIETSTLSPHNFYSSAVTELDPDRWPGGDGPKKEGEFTFSCPKEQGAVLCLPIPATRNDTVAREAFGKWMIKHIDGWFAWARKLELGIVWIKDIVLVTGTHRTRSCINVAFPARREDKEDAQASFRAKVDHRGAINWQVSHNRGAVLNRGPDGEDLPEDQCIFIRGFRVTRKLKLLPLKLKGAAGPNPDPEGYNEEPDAEDMPIEGSDAEDKPMEESDAEVMPMEEPDSDDEPDSEIMPIPDVPEYRDPLHTLLEYIAEETPNCDMVLVHDDDLTRLDGIDDGTPLDGLQSDVVLSHIRSLEPTIYKTRIDTSSTRNNTSVDTESVLVATFSNILDKRSPSSTPSAPQSLHGEMPLPREERPRGHPPFAFPEP